MIPNVFYTHSIYTPTFHVKHVHAITGKQLIENCALSISYSIINPGFFYFPKIKHVIL